MPQLTDDNRLFVHSELVIDGDVGYETGHVEFDGHIEIRGSILDGFRVTGRSLTAREINKSEVVAKQDVGISGGIIGGKVEVGGRLTASHIHNADIRAKGDIIVQREIFDSTIETRGELNVEMGKILSSKITAKKGVVAGDIGSSTSSACQFLVGVDHSYDRKIDERRRTIAASDTKRKEVKRSIEILRGKFSDLEEELGEVAQTEDRFMVQKMTLSKKLEALERVGDETQIQKAQQVLEYLDGKIEETQNKVQDLMARQDEITDIIDAQEEEILRLTVESDDLYDEIEKLQEQAIRDKGLPRVRVKGEVAAGTVIKGPNTSLATKESHKRVNIRELDVSKPDFPTLWSMTVTRL